MTRAVVFAYSEVGVRCVRELLEQGVEIALLFTHEDDPGEKQWYGSVRELASGHGIRTVTPQSPNAAEWYEAGRQAQPDFIFSFYYRYLLAAEWLKIPARGALNMHGSLLPKFRGRAPIHWAILKGEAFTGASLHYMVEKPDAGALVDQQAIPILPDDDALAVSIKVAEAARQVLHRSLPALIQGTADARPLDLRQGSYFGRRRPEDGRIDWRQGARAVHDLVRAVGPPFPGAFTEVRGLTLGIYKTQMDATPARHRDRAPCLYFEEGWYVDFADGARLKILQLAVNGSILAHNNAAPALAEQPIALA